MAYAGFFVVLLMLWAPLVLGQAIALGTVFWSAAHLVRGRPRWYPVKILKGGMVGAIAGVVVVLSLGMTDAAFWSWQIVGAGVGYGALAFARAYSAERLSPAGPAL